MPADPVSTGPRRDLPGVDRLLALSDGVVAIAITLLVLQLKVPSPAKLPHPDSASELASQLGNGADQLISYVISFYVIAQFWLVHHRVFRRITGQQEGLAWWNFAFLFTITIMPFTSDLLGEFASNPLAVDIFAANACTRHLGNPAHGDLRPPQGSGDRRNRAGNAGCTVSRRRSICSSSPCRSASPGRIPTSPNTSGCFLPSRPASPIAGPVANPPKRSSAEPMSRSSRSGQSPRTAAGAYLPAKNPPAHPALVKSVRAAQAQVRADGERAMVDYPVGELLLPARARNTIVHPYVFQSVPPNESVTAPRPTKPIPVAMRTRAQARRWRYSHGAIMRRMPDRGEMPTTRADLPERCCHSVRTWDVSCGLGARAPPMPIKVISFR